MRGLDSPRRRAARHPQSREASEAYRRHLVYVETLFHRARGRPCFCVDDLRLGPNSRVGVGTVAEGDYEIMDSLLFGVILHKV